MTNASTTAPAAAMANAMPTPADSGQPREAAAETAGPPAPIPNAVPSTSARLSEAEAQPSRPAGAARSISSDIGAYASPMPNPATVQAAMPTSTGVSGSSTDAIAAIPVMMTTTAQPMILGAGQRPFSRDCSQAPAVQASVAPVTAM